MSDIARVTKISAPRRSARGHHQGRGRAGDPDAERCDLRLGEGTAGQVEHGRVAQLQVNLLVTCESRLAVVPGVTHPFEPGSLQAAADAARDSFISHLAPTPQPVA